MYLGGGIEPVTLRRFDGVGRNDVLRFTEPGVLPKVEVDELNRK
jgi:hypothetical protein